MTLLFFFFEAKEEKRNITCPNKQCNKYTRRRTDEQREIQLHTHARRKQNERMIQFVFRGKRSDLENCTIKDNYYNCYTYVKNGLFYFPYRNRQEDVY